LAAFCRFHSSGPDLILFVDLLQNSSDFRQRFAVKSLNNCRRRHLKISLCAHTIADRAEYDPDLCDRPCLWYFMRGLDKSLLRALTGTTRILTVEDKNGHVWPF